MPEAKTYELSFKYGATPTTTVIVPSRWNSEHAHFARLVTQLVPAEPAVLVPAEYDRRHH